MSPDLAAPAIELIDVTKRYGEAVALDGLTLRIEAGEFFCLLGPSGCGKTTTLNLIGGFIPLTSGELRIEGRRVNDLPPHQRNVNTVFTLRRWGGRSLTTRPSIRSSPDVSGMNPPMRLSVVVLPQPDGPSRQKNSPESMRRFRPSSATASP